MQRFNAAAQIHLVDRASNPIEFYKRGVTVGRQLLDREQSDMHINTMQSRTGALQRQTDLMQLETRFQSEGQGIDAVRDKFQRDRIGLDQRIAQIEPLCVSSAGSPLPGASSNTSLCQQLNGTLVTYHTVVTNRPRKTLGFKTPAQVLEEALCSDRLNPSLLEMGGIRAHTALHRSLHHRCRRAR